VGVSCVAWNYPAHFARSLCYVSFGELSISLLQPFVFGGSSAIQYAPGFPSRFLVHVEVGAFTPLLIRHTVMQQSQNKPPMFSAEKGER